MYKIYGKSEIGEGTFIADSVVIGYPGKDEITKLLEGRAEDIVGAKIGRNCILREFGMIYSHAILSDNIQTGHYFMIREYTTVGAGTLVGCGVLIEDHCCIGKNVSIQSGVYIPTNTIIEDDVFIGPYAIFTNDKFMGRGGEKPILKGAKVERGARIGANSTILPGLTIGKDSLIGAGAVVTKDVKPYTVVAGVPARKIGTVPREHRLY
jgi:acetyltransferase-like isoleucine patch superfamily enzyme